MLDETFQSHSCLFNDSLKRARLERIMLRDNHRATIAP